MNKKKKLSARLKDYKRKYYKKYRAEHKEELRQYRVEYRREHKEHIKQYRKQYDISNKDKIKAQKKAYHKANKDKINNRKKAYHKANKDKINNRKKAYYKANKEKIGIQHRVYRIANKDKENAQRRHRILTDIDFKIRSNLRTRLYQSLIGINKSSSTFILLGFSIEKLKVHLENQFTFGMNWKNYGYGWHIDHIIPCSSFDLSNVEDQKKCFHYSNLQPLWASENFKKGNK